MDHFVENDYDQRMFSLIYRRQLYEMELISSRNIFNNTMFSCSQNSGNIHTLNDFNNDQYYYNMYYCYYPTYDSLRMRQLLNNSEINNSTSIGAISNDNINDSFM